MSYCQLINGFWMTGAVITLVTQPGLSQVAPPIQAEGVQTTLQGAKYLEPVSLRASDLLAQQPAQAQVTAVQLNPTPSGIEVLLETTGNFDEVLTSSVENSLITDIPNAQLRLPSGGAFRQDNPTDTITTVTVTNLDTKTIRVTVTGKAGVPTAEVSQSPQALILSVAAPTPTPSAPTATPKPTPTPVPAEPAPAELKPPAPEPQPKPPEEGLLELEVRAEEEAGGYSAPEATTATKTDTPILDIPASVQVIPQQVLEDQQVTTLEEALQNSSSVIYNSTDTNSDVNFSIRGFDQAPVLEDGFRQYDFVEIPEVANIERIEILKGPASILYGEIQPGGVINLITKRPLPEPFYKAEFQAGSFGLIRPQIDISGPLTDDGRLLYRLNAVYSRRDGYRDFDQKFEQFFIAPVLTWQISDRTSLTFDLQFSHREQPWDFGTIAFGDGVIDTPRDRIFNEPDDFLRREFLSLRLALDHQFSDQWSIRSAFRFSDSSVFSDKLSIPIAFDPATGLLSRAFALDDFDSRNFALQTNVVGELATGSVEHTLLFGVDLSRTNTSQFGLASFALSSIDVFDPDYGVDRPDLDTLLFDNASEIDRLGIYLQDQIQVFENLIALVGLRYDTVAQQTSGEAGFLDPGGDFTQNNDALIPRVGIVYKPIADLSLYASYSQSFNPNTGVSATGNPFEPERGEGFEAGIKTELFAGGLLATLAYFDITKQNVLTGDPNFPGLGISIATGEQRSRGFEFDATGQILPGWNIIASYAYTDAEVTEDNTIPIGNRLPGIPLNSANLWTTYEIQSGNLQGLGFGIGFNYVGERQGAFDNSFKVDSYFLTNAALFYRRENWRLGLNFRNLFNVDYTNSTGRFGSRTSAGLPGEPFNVVGSISVEF